MDPLLLESPICQFCRHELAESIRGSICCPECYTWIFKTTKFSWAHSNSQLDMVWYNHPIETPYGQIMVYFDYKKQITILYSLTKKAPLLEMSIQPATPQFLENIPKKIQLWITFS